VVGGRFLTAKHQLLLYADVNRQVDGQKHFYFIFTVEHTRCIVVFFKVGRRVLLLRPFSRASETSSC